MATYHFIFIPEVEEFYNDLKARKNKGDKDAKIMFDKINYCMARVEIQGTRAGERIIKNLKGKENANLYELRPLDERIFCCLWDGNKFVLLSHYTKDDDETDPIELAKARRLRDKWMDEHMDAKKK
jgi:mRNA-degrading endonuclease RelE of RelBE toxin-antitoxin system